MKKFFLLLLFLASVNAYAQKSYISLIAHGLTDKSMCYLSGSLPDGINKHYYSIEIGSLLNLLSQKGFEVEFMDISNDVVLDGGAEYENGCVVYLLSKKSPSPSQQDFITTSTNNENNKDNEIHQRDGSFDVNE